jgi:histidinol-phosphatase (PHP family)
MIPIDYHMHSSYSCDSEALMARMCRAAITAGVQEIGFSEHFDSHPDDDCSGYLEVGAWWVDLERCREQFSGVLSIKAGLEISEPHSYSEAVDQLLDSHPWDYSIGSLHWIGDDIIFKESYFKRQMVEAYEEYFRELMLMVENGRFNILGHMDIIKRYGFEYYGEYHVTSFEKLIRPILRTLAARDLALEVNTITLRRPIREASPSSQILEWFREEGGRWVTLGSDAHTADEVGADLDNAIHIVRSAGFNVLASYTGGRPSAINLTDI